MQILAVSLEIDDRIAHELSRAMERHVSTALDLEQLDAVGCQKFRRGCEVLFLGRPSQRYDWRVLDEE